ncbi:MAG: hypothetical protein ACT443_02985, partial [Gemmatimonadota bacterium]
MRAVTLASTLFIIAAGRLHAQSACWTGTNPTCNAIAQHAHIAQAAAGMASLAGNPVPGASSTLGMRIGRIPRISVAGRITGVYMELQSVAQEDFGESEKGLARTVNVDAALGVLSGWTLAPTVGGFGSLDLLLGAGTLTLPDEFTETGMSWGVGARLGILRESFTMPGVSLTGMYRRIGDIRYGTTSGCDVDFCSTTYTLRDNSVISGRAVVGKRLFVLGANLGVG